MVAASEIMNLTDVLAMMVTMLYGILLGVLAILAVMHLLIVFNTWRQQRSRRQNPNSTQPVDLSASQPPLPEQAQQLADQLTMLGFQHIGAVGSQRNDTMRIDWVYINESADVLALIVPAGNRYAALFYTVYDGLTLQTAYPMGIRITLSDFEVHSVKTSLEAAYDYHVSYSQNLLTESTWVQTFRDMTHVLPWLADHIRKHVNVQLNQMMIQSAQTAAFFVGMLIAGGIGFYALRQGEASMGLLLTLIGLAILALYAVRRWGIPTYLVTVEQRKKKKRKLGN